MNPQPSGLESDALPLRHGLVTSSDQVARPFQNAIRNGEQKINKKFATTWDRTKDLSVNSRPLCQRSSGGVFPVRELNPGLVGESHLS